MARSAIPGRPAPRRKTTSSSEPAAVRGPQRKKRISSSSAAALAAEAPAQTSATTAVTKAAKRAVLRATLLRTSRHPVDTAPGKGDTVSRSALRRRKRQARDALAANALEGRVGGVKDVQEALEGVEQDMMDADEEEAQTVKPKGVGAKGEAQKVGDKMRRKALAQETARAPVITSDPAFRANPFAALRAHAAHSLAFDNAGAPSKARKA